PLEPSLLGPAAAAAWQLTHGRHMTPEERSAVESFAEQQFLYLTSTGKGRAPDPVRQILLNLCQILLGSNEFLYVE
ncbi:MAG: hypothetical protein RL215_909, partial [Planctomycetota bacterium]